MALGFVPYVLTSLEKMEGMNYPGFKIDAAGMLAAAIDYSPGITVSSVNGYVEAATGGGIKLNTLAGQVRDVKIKYMPRTLKSFVKTAPSCDINNLQTYTEAQLSAPYYREVAFTLPWGFLERYEADAIQSVMIGKPPIGAVKELMDLIMSNANALVETIDEAILTQVQTGANIENGGLTTFKTININKNATVLDLSNGIGEMVYEYQQNGNYGTPVLVGNGLISKLEILAPAMSYNNAGLNVTGLQSGYKLYRDVYSSTQWGTNGVVAFAPGTFGFVDVDKYVGWKTGRFGTSEFGMIDLPIGTVPGQPRTMMTFNIQIKEQDCPRTVNTGGYAGTTTIGAGYDVFIGKNFGLFQQPADAFSTGDRLAGTNGALGFTFTNTCVDCPA